MACQHVEPETALRESVVGDDGGIEQSLPPVGGIPHAREEGDAIAARELGPQTIEPVGVAKDGDDRPNRRGVEEVFADEHIFAPPDCEKSGEGIRANTGKLLPNVRGRGSIVI